MPSKIGLGIVTCNRFDFFSQCFNSIPKDKIDELVVVNDGKHQAEYELSPYNSAHWIHHANNTGVGISKNDALKYLLDKGCEHIFLLEDDMIVKDPKVFEAYINAAKESGILHFNYGPGSPFNRKQDPNIRIDLDTRHLLKQDSAPNPRLIFEYPSGIKLALYEHTVAMFSYFHRVVLEKVGLHDEQFYNAWEHVDLTYRIIKAGYHPPFWYFADLANSHEMLTEAPGAIDKSSIADKKDQWHKNVYGGREKYLTKHGHYPNNPPFHTKEEVIEWIKRQRKLAKI
jgi:GT2 family glycosyltransferase